MHVEEFLNLAGRISIAVLCAQIHPRHYAELSAVFRRAASRDFRILPVLQFDDGVSIMAMLMAMTFPTTCKESDREGNISPFGEFPYCEEAE